jgi:hypothetical protein
MVMREAAMGNSRSERRRAMANRVRSTTLIIGVAVVAILLLMAQRGQAQTVGSDRAAGYVVFPKVVVDGSDAFGQGRGVDTLIQLTNTGPNCQVVECFYINATKHCTRGGFSPTGACRTNADCDAGQTCGLTTDCQGEHNRSFVLSPNQAIGWSANLGGVVPADGNCPGMTDPQPIPAAPEPFFEGEVKCVEVDGTTQQDTTGTPVFANDLKGEATIYEVEPTSASTVGGVDVRSYNAIGIQAAAQSVGATATGDPYKVCSDGTGDACAVNGDCTSPATCVNATELCLGSNGGSCQSNVCSGGGHNGLSCSTDADCGVCTTATHASCPATLVLNHFFDGVAGPVAPIVTDLTLVPCSENVSPPGPSGIRPTTAQLTVFNEFEQRFSTSLAVGCFRETQLSDIDASPGNESTSIFSVVVQGTMTGQTIIRAVTGTEAFTGHGLLGVAEEFQNFGNGFPRGSDAFNLNYAGTKDGKADVVILSQ